MSRSAQIAWLNRLTAEWQGSIFLAFCHRAPRPVQCRLFDHAVSGPEEQESAKAGSSEGSLVAEYPRTHNYEPLDSSPMNLQCVVDGLFIAGSCPPCFA
jgi:hypothetical protein